MLQELEDSHIELSAILILIKILLDDSNQNRNHNLGNFCKISLKCDRISWKLASSSSVRSCWLFLLEFA